MIYQMKLFEYICDKYIKAALFIRHNCFQIMYNNFSWSGKKRFLFLDVIISHISQMQQMNQELNNVF